MTRTSSNVAPALQAYFRETSAEAEGHLGDAQAVPTAEPPWSGRRLKHALAELGPAQPAPPVPRPDPVVRTQPLGGWRRPLPPPTVPAPAVSETAESAPRQDARPGQDLPPAVASLIAALPLPDPTPLADGHLAPDEIVRALAGTSGPASSLAMPAPSFLPPPQAHEIHDRPPMIIERAHSERALLGDAQMAKPVQRNPLAALVAGFACAVATGAVVYAVLVLR